VIRYQEIYETLKSEILSGKYSCSGVFPSSMTLANRFRTTRATIRRTVDKLRSNGLVRSRQGAGTYVTREARSRRIGLIVPDHGRSEFFPAVVKEISRLAQKESYTLLFGEIVAETADGRVRQVERLALEFIDQKVSRVIYQPIDYIANSEAANRRVLALFDKASIPVVLSDYDFVESPARSKYDVVGINNVEAGALIVEHLLSVGAKNIHFHLNPLAPQSHRNFIRGAVNAYRDRNAKAGMNVLTCDACDLHAVRKYVRKNHPDAFVCGNDSSAAHLKKTLWSFGVAVPQDILLTGVNDLQIASLLTPTLTTIHIPCEEIAEKAFSVLLSRMKRPSSTVMEVFLPVHLVVRDSTRRETV